MEEVQRQCDVLEFEATCIFEVSRKFTRQLAIEILRNHETSWWRLCLNPLRKVHTGAIEIVLILNDLADMCSQPKFDSFVPRQFRLNLHRTIDRSGNGAKS